MKRLYQWVDWPGRNISREGRGRDRSKFWNEGRWNNFIKPLIPKEALDFPFLEVGCNAGLYLKMAEDMGFRHVIGIDNDADRIEQAKLYRAGNGGKYEIRHETVGSNYDWNLLPRFGLVVFSNTHYYFPVVDFAETVANLRDRALYCIVVGNFMDKKNGLVSPRLWRMKNFFCDWTEMGTVEKLSRRGDPSPRKNMYGILFKSNLETMDLDKWYNDVNDAAIGKLNFACVLDGFYRQLSQNIDTVVENTAAFDFYVKNRSQRSPDAVRRFLLNKKELFIDIKNNGIKKAVYLTDWKFEDGMNRCIIARVLGYKKIIIKNMKRPPRHGEE